MKKYILVIILLIVQVNSSLAQSPYIVRNFSVNSQTFYSYLPFDVPFIIQGTIDTTIIHMTGYYKIVNNPCDGKIDTVGNVASCNCKGKDCDKKWRKMEWNRIYEDKKLDSFSFIVDPLKPNKNYQFVFSYVRLPLSSEVKIFQNETDSVLSRYLKTSDGVFTKQFYKAVNDSLQNKLKCFIKNGRIYFDSCCGKSKFQTVLEALGEGSPVFEMKKDYIGNAKGFDKQYSEKIAVSLSGLSSKSKLMGQIIGFPNSAIPKRYPNGINYLRKLNLLVNLDKSLVSDIAFGKQSFDTVINNRYSYSKEKIENYWIEDTLLINQRIANLQKTEYNMQSIRDMLFDMSLNNSILTYGGQNIDATQMAALYTDINTTINSMQLTIAKLTELKYYLHQIQTEIQIFVSKLLYDSRDIVLVTGSTSNTFQTRAKSYMSLDLGLAYVSNINKISPYVGTNVYFRPVNKEQHIRLLWSGQKFDDFNDLGKRFSIMFGLTTQDFSDTNRHIANLLGSFNLVTGAGFRISDAVRLNYGLVWYYNTNKAFATPHITCNNMISISVDADIKTFINELIPSTITLSSLE